MARPAANHTLTRNAPRISANDLARYMVASETGKLGIIRSARESVTPQRTRYRDARDAVKAYLSDENRDIAIIDAARDMLDQRAEDVTESGFRRDDAAKSVAALDALIRIRNQLGGYDYVRAPARQPKLNLSGVEVSVNTDLIVHRTRGQREQIGAALFRFTMADDETPAAQAKRREVGAYAATLVHMQVVENLVGNREPHHSLCMSVDVQFEEIHLAPRTYAQKAQNLENACRFIHAMWDIA